MTNILYFIILGVLFYLMIRKGGCGMGMGHGHGNQGQDHSHGESHALPKGGDGTKRKDPVCGMDVDIDSARFISFYKDRTFYFCSEDCKGKFEGTPAEFIEKEGKKGGCC